MTVTQILDLHESAVGLENQRNSNLCGYRPRQAECFTNTVTTRAAKLLSLIS